MQREIKFRVWDKDKKEMTLQNSFYELQKWNRTEQELKSFEIVEYTALKDKNGVEIYEGDIISFIQFNELWKARVIFYNGNFSYQEISHRIPIQSLNVIDKTVEVIGNIYQNKELLKQHVSTIEYNA